MSTFNGLIAEFPQIRVDYFRRHPREPAPLACFLSHVHSDHLNGLESLRSPFVYCSPATREILLRLEKYHCRLNFAKGILERRNVTYDKKRKIIKPLPLETPTTIELTPREKIRVTLLDANHCVGAVMFLIEGNGKAVLYTGDIRAEPWWVNSIVQNPALLPYTLPHKKLDCVYLDTTFATKSEPYREFSPKADGIRELVEKVSKYPRDTIFYFHSWTFGYENVWIALSSFLGSKIHLDPYRFQLYDSLKQPAVQVLGVREAAALCGFQLGNHHHTGCLTRDPNVRLHSCELGMGCPVIDKNENAVHIIPIVNRIGDTEILELGAGGGKGDLDQTDELETADPEAVGRLMQMCSNKITDPELLSQVLALLSEPLKEGKDKITLSIDLLSQNKDQTKLGEEHEGDLSLQELIDILTASVAQTQIGSNAPPTTNTKHEKIIKFPYSRHSSYGELCALIHALQPRDVYPCTVDEKTWTPEISMRNLFGQDCSSETFRHDRQTMAVYEDRMRREKAGKRGYEHTQEETQRRDENEEDEAEREGETQMRIRTEERTEVWEEFLGKIKSAAKVLPTPGEQLNEPDGPEPRWTRVSVNDQINKQSDVPISEARCVSHSLHPESTSHAPPEPGPEPSAPPHPQIAPAPRTSASTSTTPHRTSHARHSSLSHPRSKRPRLSPPRWTPQGIAYQAALGFGLDWWDVGLVSTRQRREREDDEGSVEL